MISSYTEERLDRLQSRIRLTQVVRTDLLTDTVTALGIEGDTRDARRIDRLIRSAAWTEAALAAVEIALPRWRPRRLACEDGNWHCALSRHWNAPDWLDDSIESDHALLPLAILSAAVEARLSQTSTSPAIQTVPKCPVLESPPAGIMCCDNFA
jgi:hypothetical protein